MFCTNCGIELDDKVNYCPNCGAKVCKGIINCEEDIEGINADINHGDDCEHNDDDQIIWDINGIKINFSDLIDRFPNNKIVAIKELRTMSGIGLADAKSYIDKAYAIYQPKEISSTNADKKQKSLWAQVREQGRIMSAQQDAELRAKKERAAQLDRDGIAYCPKCLSQSLSANKKGFGVGKAVLGGWAVGPLGLVAGNLGAKKVRVTCLKCGHQFWAGKK